MLAETEPERRADDPGPGPRAVAAIDGWTDAQLLHDRQRPGESFSVFYRRHVDALFRLAASRGLDADTAADVVADTFFAALRRRSDYRPQGDTARLWLLGIAVRRIADVHRRRAADGRREARLRHELPPLTEADREGYEDLRREVGLNAMAALGDLPPEQQAAIRARVLEARSYAELAATLGVSEPAVRQRVSRGLAALRAALGSQR